MSLSHLLSGGFAFGPALADGFGAGAGFVLALTLAFASVRGLTLLPADEAVLFFFAVTAFLLPPLAAPARLPADERDAVRDFTVFARGAWSFCPIVLNPINTIAAE
jgi:hypothetical protein